METTSIDEAKALLYGHPAESFIAERDVLTKAIRAGGDRELANEVKALRKPSAVAAEVNQLVRADPDGVDLILQAAALLRSAQAGALEGSGINTSVLQQQYRVAIGAVAQSAPNRRAEVRAALEAATIDEASNEDLRTGCLVVVPTPVSIFGSAPRAPVDPKPKSNPAPTSEQATGPVMHLVPEPALEQPVDELEERRALRRADQAAKTEAANQAEHQKLAAAEKAAAENRAAAVAERQRKAAEKERRKKRKELQNRHRDALRSHLAALDEEVAAAEAAEQAEQQVDQVNAEMESAEKALADVRWRRQHTVADRDLHAQAKAEAGLRVEEAQASVDGLAETLASLEDSTS